VVRFALVMAWLLLAAGTAQTPAEIPPAYEQAAENEHFILYVDEATLAFKLLDKRSGYLWHSGLDEALEGDRLNRSWQAFARSGLSIEYLDTRGSSARASLSNSEHTLEVTPLEDGVEAQVSFTEYGISALVSLRLTPYGLRAEVPSENVREDDPRFRLGRLYLYPFLGATRGGSVPGYMVLPDGTGSLIRFAETTRAENMFYGRYYGPDLGMVGTLPYDPLVNPPYPISFPVYGLVHGEGVHGEGRHALLAVVEEGAAYGELQAHPAGISTNFNFLTSAFIYNETYFQRTNRAGDGVTVVQRERNDFGAAVQYHFLTGADADYVGMARRYRQVLLEQGLLPEPPPPQSDIGIRLEVLGGDKERVLFWHRFVPMTTLGQMRDMLKELDVRNPEVVYYGWQPFGASSMPPLGVRLERSLGTLDELRALAEDALAGGGRLSLYLEPQAALMGESGYSERHDLALAVTGVNLWSYDRAPAYQFTLEALERRFAALAGDAAARLPDAGLALSGVGWTLYSDFRGGRAVLGREGAAEAYQALLAAAPQRLGLYRPNAYLFGVARAYYDMPLGDNGYIYTDEAVPFLPIVLSGHIPYYGPALNFSADLTGDLLRHADYGVYPSFFLTHGATAELLDTPSSWLYTSSYAQWAERIEASYRWLNALLAPVRGQEIVARRRLAEGVYATTYESGRTVVVNYGERAFALQGRTVPAKDAALWEAAP
jgi:hypothetical protein